MATSKELGVQVNDLRQRLGMAPLKGLDNAGPKKLTPMLEALQKQWAEKNPPPPPPPPAEQPKPAARKAPAAKPTDFHVLEDLPEEQLELLIQPRVPETIKAMSYRLLTHVHRVDETDKRTVGLLYGTIVALVRRKFPKAETSLECLRWYSVHMRQENIKLPQKRPRPLVRA